MEYKRAKGTKDYFGIEMLKLNFILEKLRKISNNFNFYEVITPTFEYTELFKRLVGEGSDVVNKEMYTFIDKGNRNLTLIPEGTSPIARMVLENKLLENNQRQSLFYISKMFRYERPQKGRQREFIQFGVERFGEGNLIEDIEIILFAKQILDELKITKYELRINSIGSVESRNKYNKILKEYFELNYSKLSQYSKIKFDSNNLLKILDSKEISDLDLLKNSPSILNSLSEIELEKFNSIKKMLKNLNIKFIEDQLLIRGLDYYNDFVFEFVSTDLEKLGSKSTLIGGGRYDYLISQLDNSKYSPAIGYAAGIERLMLASENYLNKIIKLNNDYYVISISKEYEVKAIEVCSILRNKNLSVLLDVTNKKIGKKIEKANKQEYKFIIIVGEEINNNEVVIKNLITSEQKNIKLEEI